MVHCQVSGHDRFQKGKRQSGGLRPMTASVNVNGLSTDCAGTTAVEPDKVAGPWDVRALQR